VKNLIKNISDEEVESFYEELCQLFPGMDAEIHEMFPIKESYARQTREIVEHNLRQGTIRRRKGLESP